MTGVWVLAHDCGHQSFTESKHVNNSVGLVLHSLLLVPYHSWRISHSQHHKGTSHMGKDSVFVPATRSFDGTDKEEFSLNVSPLVNFFQICVMVFLGWPGYLLFNIASQKYDRFANHFSPNSPIFKPEQYREIVISDLGLLCAVSIFAWFSYTYSFASFVCYYGMPYIWTNFWLILITYLQHTDLKIPHYRGDQWTFIRGALATVDRDYGILNRVFHHIGDTHVCHHLFSTMPHYHAQEATEHLKKALGHYYLFDNTAIATSLWKSWKSCQFVDAKGQVLFYNKKATVK